MRIETYNQVAQLYQGSKTGKTQKLYDKKLQISGKIKSLN